MARALAARGAADCDLALVIDAMGTNGNPDATALESPPSERLLRYKDADVPVWSGDPLEALSYARNVIVAGVEQSTLSRHLHLQEH
jgi:hypothetical protein